MIKQFLLLLIFCAHLSTGIAFAQSIQSDTSINKDSSSLSIQIDEINNTLEKLKKSKLLDTEKNNGSDTAINELLAQIPVTTDTIDHRIDALISKKEIATTKQIQAANQLKDKLTKSKDTITTEQQYLLEDIEELTQQEEIIKSIQQLLDNPLNQKQISPEELQKALQFNTAIEQLKKHYLTVESHHKQQIQRLDNAIELLNRWNNALTNSQLQITTNAPHKNSEKIRLSDLQKRYQDEAKTLISELNQKRSTSELIEIEKLQEAIYQKQTMAWLVKTDIELANIVKDNFTLSDDISDIPIDVLEQQLFQVNHSLKQLNTLKKNIQDDFERFKKREEITGQNTILNDAFQQRLKAITLQHLQLSDKPNKLTQLISAQQYHHLITRTPLITDESRQIRLDTVNQSLVQIAYQVKISFTTLINQLLKSPYKIIALTFFSLLLLYLFVQITSRWFSKPFKLYDDKIDISAGIRKIIYTLGKHRYFFLTLLFLHALVGIADVPYPSDAIIQTLIYSLAGIVLWLELTQIDSKLYKLSGYFRKTNITTSLILLATILLYTLAKMSSVSPTLVLVYEKLLMLAIIAFVLTLRISLIHSLKRHNEQTNEKLYGFYMFLFQRLLWVIIAICIINLIGYNKISWIALTYLGVSLLYIIILVSGVMIINHLRKQAKLYCLRRFEHGAFIAQDIISPINFISKILWVWGITAILFNIMDWNRSSYFISQILIFFNYPLLVIGETSVTLLLVILSVLAIYLIYRTAKWLKSFSYHWLYTKVNDLGLRNSLSIFTQYIAILAGVLIAMNILGIDLTSLAVFAGALGVGVGLGLQDIAKNFISGILLLIERPLRSGDWVSIDGSEGRVKSIGMRAITLETFDKQEVSVPNGNAIGNSFVNFTHSNSIVRTILYVGASYTCTPDLVINTIEKVLNNIEGILQDPAYKIVMWEYADSSINYRIQYFIDTDSFDRQDTQTEVLRAIWYAFEENNIEIPFPQRDINFRNLL